MSFFVVFLTPSIGGTNGTKYTLDQLVKRNDDNLNTIYKNAQIFAQKHNEVYAKVGETTR